jgi:hypothetical protein
VLAHSIRMLEARSLSYVDGPVPIPTDDPFLFENVKRICICDTGMIIYVICELFSFGLYYSCCPYSECLLFTQRSGLRITRFCCFGKLSLLCMCSRYTCIHGYCLITYNYIQNLGYLIVHVFRFCWFFSQCYGTIVLSKHHNIFSQCCGILVIVWVKLMFFLEASEITFRVLIFVPMNVFFEKIKHSIVVHMIHDISLWSRFGYVICSFGYAIAE